MSVTKEVLQKRVVVFIKNPTDPSSYYRILQYLCKKEEIEFCCYSSDWLYRWYYNIRKNRSWELNRCRKMLRKCILASYGILHNSYKLFQYCNTQIDYIIVSRTVLPRFIPFFGRRLLYKLLKKNKVIWDFDDNIIEDKEITTAEAKLLCEYANQIVLSNDYLKNTLPKYVLDRVQVLCTTDKVFQKSDITEFIAFRKENYESQITLIWVGTKCNLWYLEDVLMYLDEAAKELQVQSGKKLVLWCISNGQISNPCKWLDIQNITWSRVKTTELLKKAHIGLMPLKENDYSLGKAGFKAVQYISSGMPAVVSDVGYCKEVIDEGINGYLIRNKNEWKRAIIKLSTNIDYYIQCSIQARYRWESKFNSQKNQEFWEEMLHNGQ